MDQSMTNSQQATVAVLTHVFSALSVAGSLCIIGTYIFDRNFRTSYNRLVFNMAVADFFMCFSLFFAHWPASNRSFCIWQGLMVQIFVIASVLWNAALSVNVGLLFFFHLRPQELEKIDRFYHLIWLAAAIIAFSLFAAYNPDKGPVYGPTRTWCWITQDYDGLRFGAYFGIIFFVFILSLVTYALVGRVIWKSDQALAKFQNQISSHGSSTATKSNATPADLHGASSLIGLQSSSSLTLGESPVLDTSKGIDHKLALNTAENAVTCEKDIPHADKTELSAAEQALPKSADCDSPGFATTNLSLQSCSNLGTATNSSDQSRGHFHFRKTSRMYVKKVSFYLIIYLINFVPGSANRIYMSTHDNQANYALIVLNSIFTPSRGLLNALAYFIPLYFLNRFSFHVSKFRFFARKNPEETKTVQSTTSMSETALASNNNMTSTIATTPHTPGVVFDPLEQLAHEAEQLFQETAPETPKTDRSSLSFHDPAARFRTATESKADACSLPHTSGTVEPLLPVSSASSSSNAACPSDDKLPSLQSFDMSSASESSSASAPRLVEEHKSVSSGEKRFRVSDIFRKKEKEASSWDTDCLFNVNSDGFFSDGVPSMQHIQHHNDVLEYMEVVRSSYSHSKHSSDEDKSHSSANSVEKKAPSYAHKFVSVIKDFKWKPRISMDSGSVTDRNSVKSVNATEFTDGSLHQHFAMAGNSSNQSDAGSTEKRFEAPKPAPLAIPKSAKSMNSRVSLNNTSHMGPSSKNILDESNKSQSSSGNSKMKLTSESLEPTSPTKMVKR